MTPPRQAGARSFPVLLAGWLAAVLFSLWLYREGLSTWFRADDFAWLGLLRQVDRFPALIHALFAPSAQGTFRFISERGFFLAFESLFGFDNVPWRIAVFATVAADVALVIWLTLRLTNSRLAAIAAPFLWLANSSLVIAMTWDAAWNEVLCPLFLLAALASFIRFAETGRARFWWLQLVIFLFGFGVLEINVVYPVLAAAWIGFVLQNGPRRRLFVSLIPLVVISAAYFLLHRAVAPFQAGGPYALHFDGRIFATLSKYWAWSFISAAWTAWNRPRGLGTAIALFQTAALLGFVLYEWRAGRKAVLFGLAWFAVTLGPMLPLPDHLSDYYLTIPVIGLALIGGAAIGRASTAGLFFRVAVAASALLYLGALIPVTRSATHWWYERAYPVRALVLGVQAARKTHPGKAIAIEGVTSVLWDEAFAHHAFYPLGIDDVYLTPGSELTIQPSSGSEFFPNTVLEPGVMRHAVTHDNVVIYSVVGDHLRNVTVNYQRSADQLPEREPSRVEIGNPLDEYLLGPEWFPLESGFRWMPAHASLRLGGPLSVGDKISVDGYRPELQLHGAVPHLKVTINGILAGDAKIDDPIGDFHRLYNVPPELLGLQDLKIDLYVNPVVRGPDGAARGLVFGTIAIHH